MKKYFLYSIASIGTVLLATACQENTKKETAPANNLSLSQSTSDHFTLTGKAPQQGQVVLYQYKDRTYTPVDSTTIQNGVFQFQGKLSEPLVYAIRLNGKGPRIHFYLENAPLQVTLNPDWGVEHLSSTENTQWFHRYNTLAQNNMLDLQQEIKEAPASPALAYFLARLAYQYDYPTLVELRKALDPALNNNPYLQELDASLELLSKVQPGAQAPDITLEDAQGKNISLSQLRGKLVLSDFWATWCPDCRKGIPELKALYDTYKDKDFTILSASYDHDRNAWQQFIQKEQLLWHHGIAPGDWKSDAGRTYAIRWLPTAILIGKDGRILARSTKLSELIPVIKENL